jgi:hypothetical protein
MAGVAELTSITSLIYGLWQTAERAETKQMVEPSHAYVTYHCLSNSDFLAWWIIPSPRWRVDPHPVGCCTGHVCAALRAWLQAGVGESVKIAAAAQCFHAG